MDGVKFSSQIIEVFDYLCKKFGIVIDWSSENVLPYIQTLCEKYIKWEISTSIVWLIIGVIIMVLGFLIWRIDMQNKYEYIGPTIFGIFIILIGFVVVCVQSFDIVKCNIFPELQIIEYIKHLSLIRTN